MTEEPYSNREIREFIEDIKNDLAEIKHQTIKTNGRVGKLENWRWFLAGGLTILSILVVPVLVKVIATKL